MEKGLLKALSDESAGGLTKKAPSVSNPIKHNAKEILERAENITDTPLELA
jgi:hypothetical protein